MKRQSPDEGQIFCDLFRKVEGSKIVNTDRNYGIDLLYLLILTMNRKIFIHEIYCYAAIDRRHGSISEGETNKIEM